LINGKDKDCDWLLKMTNDRHRYEIMRYTLWTQPIPTNPN